MVEQRDAAERGGRSASGGEFTSVAGQSGG
jgi:hypothetical protein